MARAGLGGGLANAFKAAQIEGSHGGRSRIAHFEGEIENYWRIAIHVPETPWKVRAEKSTLQAKEHYDKLKNATEELSGGFKDAYETATEGTRDYGVRLIEAGRTNLNAAFDYTTELLSAKSPSEAIELSTAQLRKQFETLSEQSKELATLAQKIATETAEPIRESVNRVFGQAA